MEGAYYQSSFSKANFSSLKTPNRRLFFIQIFYYSVLAGGVMFRKWSR
jgi:hypothetical protein